jgi:hypothetical protein
MRLPWPRLACLILALAAACGGDDPSSPDGTPAADAPGAPDATIAVADATPDPFACAGDPAPMPPGPIALDGAVFAVADYQVTALPGAAVELRRASDGAVVGQAVTGPDGRYTLDLAEPVAGTFVVTAAGYLPTRAHVDLPLAGDPDPLLLVADATELAAWYADAGATYAPGARTVIALVRDCGIHEAPGATLETAPAAAITYYDPVAQRWDPALTAAPSGFALATGLAANAVALTARAGTATFPAEPITALPDTLTLALISPFQ